MTPQTLTAPPLARRRERSDTALAGPSADFGAESTRLERRASCHEAETTRRERRRQRYAAGVQASWLAALR